MAPWVPQISTKVQLPMRGVGRHVYFADRASKLVLLLSLQVVGQAMDSLAEAR